MYIALVSESKNSGLTKSILEQIASALETQLYQHYARLWQSSGVVVKVFDNITDIPNDGAASPLVIFDTPDQAGVLGYHAVTPTGLPYGKAFLTPILDSGGSFTRGANSLSCTISHEGLEMVGDPYINFWADMPTGEEDAMELCDRCEADAYDIDDGSGNLIAMSNFLGPRAFRDGPGPYCWLGSQNDPRGLQSPWELRPGGYAIRRTGGPTGITEAVWGDSYPSWKKDLKKHPAARTSKRLKDFEGEERGA